MKLKSLLLSTTLSCASLPSVHAEVTATYPTDKPAAGSIRFRWNYGSVAAALNRDPRVQVQAYNADTFLMRENMCINFEAPFMYLLLGNDRALLIDTGATSNAKYFPLRATVDALLKRWCTTRGKTDVPLTIVLTSPEDESENDGWRQFQDRPNTTLEPLSFDGAKTFLGLTSSWPNENGKIDLGGRVVTVIPTPGSHKDGVTFYDPYTQFLFTGDFIYSGRILIGNEKEFIASATKLKAFVDSHPVKWLLGSQIEMTNQPGVDYARRITYRPNEHVLQLEPGAIEEVLEWATKLAGKSEAVIRKDFYVMNGVGPGTRTFTRPEDLGTDKPLAGAGLR